MSRDARPSGAVGLIVVALALIVGVGGTIVAVLGVGERSALAAASPSSAPTAGDTFEPVLGLPGSGGVGEGSVVIVGGSPREARGEVWAYGTIGDVPAELDGDSYANQYVLLKHTEGGNWQVVPLPALPDGAPASADTSGTFPVSLGPLGGRTTAAGGVVLLTEAGIVSRDPGGQPKLVPAPEAKLLGTGESLPPQQPPEHASTPFSGVEESGQGESRTGVFIVPYGDGGNSTSPPRVLHYDGVKWSDEMIGVNRSDSGIGPEADFTPEALACGGDSGDEVAASSPGNCWLLAGYKSEPGAAAPNRLALFRRYALTSGPSPEYEWRRQPVAGGLLGEEVATSSATALHSGAQMLTVTSSGVWVDFAAKPIGSSRSISVSELVSNTGSEASARKWCYPPMGSSCPSLGSSLPARYQSFAWPGTGEDPGTRIITGLSGGAMLELSGGQFSYEIGAGGRMSGSGGAAFSTPNQGWVANGVGSLTVDGEGQSQLIHVTSEPQGDQLQSAPVPFRYPLLAVAQAPGTAPADPSAPAIAVGTHGQIGHYVPGQGWQPESLLSSSGQVQTPTLRGVSWPQPGRAYAVGDSGAMWLWQADTGLWEPDPGKPLNLVANLTAIAFAPSNPDLGYAVGKGGVLLRFGKSWVQEQLPPALANVNFTSVAFSGSQALASYRVVLGSGEVGGLAVKEGEEPWHVDPTASALLAELPHATDTVLSKVAGLQDGGAVSAGPGLVIERESQSGPWHFSREPLPEARNVSALAAYRDASGVVRAVVSVDLDEALDPNSGIPLKTGPWSGDVPPPSGPEEPPFLPPADPLPDSGYLLKETGSGWEDMEHMALQAGANGDMPVRPDPVLALLVESSGDAGLAVGGQTYDDAGANTGAVISGQEAPFETAAAMRFGNGASSSQGDAAAAMSPQPGVATFAVGGEAACGPGCAEMANEGLGADVALSHALARAGQIAASSAAGPREFLYTGGRVREAAPLPAEEPRRLEAIEAEERQLARYAGLLGQATIPVKIAAPPGDVLGSGAFSASLEPFFPGATYYSYISSGSSGAPVKVIVLDYSGLELGAAQHEWLEHQLHEAAEEGHATVVMGNAPLNVKLSGESPIEARDAEAVAAALVQGGASAYLFDYPGANVQTQISFGGKSIPAFGSGTLGYTPSVASFTTDSLASSGFLMLEVQTSARNPATNVAPVVAHVEPNIASLALNATDGALLRRSQVALFEALARRPPQGVDVAQRQSGGVTLLGAEPYDHIPFNCLGANCADAVETAYTFTSSDPEIGNFVAHDPTSANPRQVLLGANQLPVANPHSGLFCAFNAGTTTVSITTGGLTYSEPVTVQGGSVEYPCGTVKLKVQPAAEAPAKVTFTAPNLSPASSPPAPASPQLPNLVVPPAPVPLTPAPPARPLPLSSFPPPPLTAVAVPVILPLPTLPVEPTPPSGSAQVFEPAPATKEENQEEEAIETSESASVYDPNRGSGPGPWIVLLAVVAAGAGVGLRRPRRSPREQAALAFTTPRRASPLAPSDSRRRGWGRPGRGRD